MFCTFCGTKIKDGWEFCGSCGKSVDEMLKAADSQLEDASSEALGAQGSSAEREIGQVVDSGSASVDGNAGAEAQPIALPEENKEKKRRLPWVAVAIAAAVLLAIVAGGMLLANRHDQEVSVTSIEASSESAEDSEANASDETQTETEVESEAAAEAELSEDEQLAQRLAGWWAGGSVQGGQLTPFLYIAEDGRTYGYTWDDAAQNATPGDGNPGKLVIVSRFEEEEFPEDSTFAPYGYTGAQSGWIVTLGLGEEADYEYHVFEDASYIGDGSSVGSYQPVVNLPDGLAEIEEQIRAEGAGADAAADQGSASSDDSNDSDASAQQAKIDAAVADGKQVFSGTIEVHTDTELWEMRGSQYSNYGTGAVSMTVLVFDEPSTVEGMRSDAGGEIPETATAPFLRIDDSFFDTYGGQHVTMAFDHIWFPNDVSPAPGSDDGEVLFADE